MTNITSTRWIDNTHNTLEEVDKLFQSPHPDSATMIKWEVSKEFGESQSMVLNGKDVSYNYYTFSFDQITAGVLEDEDPIRKTGFIIPYRLNGKIRYIISRNSVALTILRKMLNCTGKGVVEKNNPGLSADLFVWLVSRVYRGDNLLECESNELENLTFDSIRGFKGDTEDLLTRVTATGESVINIISTLSFFLESQKLNQINLDLRYRRYRNIDVSFSHKNAVSINLERCLGDCVSDSTCVKATAELLLLLYTEILPIIVHSYQDEVASNQWGQKNCIEFLNSVATDLSQRVKQRVEELDAMPLQLALDSNGIYE